MPPSSPIVEPARASTSKRAEFSTSQYAPMRHWRAGPSALIVYLFALAYASLAPFFGWHAPEAFTLFSWPKYLSVFDFSINVLAYLPLGIMLAANWRQRMISRGQSHRIEWQAFWFSVLVATGFSILMELLQSMLPGRVSSLLDWVANGAGAAIGATAVLIPPGRALLRRIDHWRQLNIVPGTMADWALLLIALWFFAQLNPAIPFFEAGSVVSQTQGVPDRPHPYDLAYLVPQAVGIACNVSAFALMISLTFRAQSRVWIFVVFILAAGFLAKVTMAALMLKAPQLIGWMGPATIIGLTSGLLVYTFLSRRSYRWRAFWATLLIFAGSMLVKLSGVYNALSEMLRLFDWSYGHLVSFAELTRWVHEVWPLFAFVFLTILFVKHRHDH
jgi:VanZ family protein